MKISLLVLVLAFLLSATSVSQTTIRVPQDYLTIQGAIDAAVPGDTVIVSPGTYDAIDFLDKSIVVRGVEGAGVTSIVGIGERGVIFSPGHTPTSQLIGFRITGETDSLWLETNGLGVYCPNSTPYIADCVIEDCSSFNGWDMYIGNGAGVFGNPILERCTIRNNDAWNGGGVYGAPTMIDCIVEDNYADCGGGGVYGSPAMVGCELRFNRARGGVINELGGGGAYLQHGACLLDCVVTQNQAGPNCHRYGCAGAFGGGVYAEGGTITLEHCLISDNTVDAISSGPSCDVVGYGGGVFVLGGDIQLDQCTVADNHAFNCAAYGGVTGTFTARNTIVWNNVDPVGYYATHGDFAYCNAPDTPPGVGNLSTDPQFVGPNDYALAVGSPCIDSGDPSAPLDPDYTRADMGARFFNHHPPSTAIRNGSGVNPVCFSSTSEPRLGLEWTSAIDTSVRPVTSVTFVFGYAHAEPLPYTLAFGEVLLDALSPHLFTTTAGVSGNTSVHTILVPPDPLLLGDPAYTQALLAGGGLQLGNGIDLTLGA